MLVLFVCCFVFFCLFASMEDQSKSSNMTFESTNDFKSQGSMTDAIVMMSFGALHTTT